MLDFCAPGGVRVKIVVVSPHREDAAFSLGLAVGAWLEQGHSVEVVNCFTRSEFAPYSDADSLHANDRMSFVSAVRKRETEAWRKLYGAAKLTLTDLNLKDAPLRLHRGAEEVYGLAVESALNPSSKATLKIRGAVEKADALVLPLGLGAHVDHVTARDAGATGQSVELPIAFYEELPEAAVDVDGAVQEILRPMGLELEAVFAGEPAATEAEVDAAVKRKRRVAWCFDSQINEQVTTQIAEACRGYGGRERMWGNAAWRRAFEGLTS